MKLVTFRHGGRDRLGVVQGAWVVDVSRLLRWLSKEQVPAEFSGEPSFQQSVATLLAAGPAPLDMIALLARGEAWRRALGTVAQTLCRGLGPETTTPGLRRPLKKARLRPPIPRPSKVICLGRNYAAHAAERGSEVPAQPLYFAKCNNAICGPGDAIVLPPNSTQVDYEAELAVVIGAGGRSIPEERAYEHVAGFLAANDVSARDVQARDGQWFRGKSCDTFAPIGPWLVTRDEIPDPDNLHISLTLNGRVMQDSNTRFLIFKIPFLISYLSQSLTWETGDLILTGTPAGIGAHRNPPIFLKPGDEVSVMIEGIGTLTNHVARA